MGGALNALTIRLIPSATARRWLSWILPASAVMFAVTVYPYPAPGGVILNGAIVGGRIALIALGIALVYRANRVINFAAAELGLVPTVFAVVLVITAGWSYLLGAAAGLVAAIVVGFVVQSLIVRRFSQSPRLILTVATIGISQLLIGVSLFLPGWMEGLTGGSFETFGDTQLVPPFTMRWEFGGLIFNANDIISIAVIPVCFVALAWFLTRSSTGMAVRAAAERSDRAAMLGIPVKRIHTVVWIIATVLAFVALYLRAGSSGLPLGKVLGPAFLLQAIAAVVIGRFESFPTIAFASIGIGMLDQANTFQQGNRPAFNDVTLFLIVVAALLLTRSAIVTRAGDVSTWKATGDVRPIPAELAHLPEVRYVRWGGMLVLTGLVLAIPLWLTEAQMNLATVVVIFGIVAISLVVLTGWAGQVSLGQVAFVAVGAAVGGALTARAGWDISLALLAGGVAGAIVAVVVGYPAIRRRGLTLAVVTYGFALVVSTYFVNREFFGDWLPPSRLERPDLFGLVDIASETRFYYFCLAMLVVVIVLVRGIRNSRTGRARSWPFGRTRTRRAPTASTRCAPPWSGSRSPASSPPSPASSSCITRTGSAPRSLPPRRASRPSRRW